MLVVTWGMYSEAFGCADNLKLLTPIIQALHIPTNICVEYATKQAKYDSMTINQSMLNGKNNLQITNIYLKSPSLSCYIN